MWRPSELCCAGYPYWGHWPFPSFWEVSFTFPSVRRMFGMNFPAGWTAGGCLPYLTVLWNAGTGPWNGSCAVNWLKGRGGKTSGVSAGRDGRRLAEQARSVERIRKRLLLKDHIRLLPLEDVPDGLEWQTGMEEPDVGDPRAVKGGRVRLWINTPFPGTLRAFGPGSENFFNYSAIDNVWLPLVGLHPETFRPIPGLADRWALSDRRKKLFFIIWIRKRPIRTDAS